MLDAARINLVRPEYIFVLFAEIFAHDGDDPNLREVARSKREVCCRSAEAAIDLAGRTLDAVICDRTDNDNRH
jgi:hypothetical protein